MSNFSYGYRQKSTKDYVTVTETHILFHRLPTIDPAGMSSGNVLVSCISLGDFQIVPARTNGLYEICGMLCGAAHISEEVAEDILLIMAAKKP